MGEASGGQLHICLVLHRRDYQNTSLLVELFSSDLGRFPVVAKGARSSRTVPVGLLQPFQPIWASWTGRGEVKTLMRAEAAGAPLVLQGQHLFCGFYVNELVLRLTGRNDCHEGLFDHYVETLNRLAAGKDPADVLRRFELELLRELGYSPLLEREADTGVPVRSDRRYTYVPERGPIPVSHDGSVSDSVSGQTLLRLAAGDPLAPGEAREARQLLRSVLGRYLGERPLKSRELFRQWRAS